MAAHEAAHDQRFPARFHAWCCAHIAPNTDRETTERLITEHEEEFEFVGVHEEEDQFAFLYARALMPEMGDEEYLETMDTIMAPAPLAARLERLRAIAEEFGHGG
ncbi:MAG: hypothetical protein AAGE86_06540 [Pseudomonadota bacterium]